MKKHAKQEKWKIKREKNGEILFKLLFLHFFCVKLLPKLFSEHKKKYTQITAQKFCEHFYSVCFILF